MPLPVTVTLPALRPPTLMVTARLPTALESTLSGHAFAFDLTVPQTKARKTSK
jgi:hypothetical protein